MRIFSVTGIFTALAVASRIFAASGSLRSKAEPASPLTTFFTGQPKPEPTVAAAPKPVEEPFLKFERARREVDKDPRAWLANEPSKELLAAGIQTPLDSPNPEFLYLYGRANLLTGNPDEAWRAFEAAVSKADSATGPQNALVKKEATLGMAAVSLKTQSSRQKALSHYDELTKPPANQTAP